MLDSLCVTTSTEIAPTKNRKELAARIGWLVLICATLYICYFSHLGAIGFVGPDEPRYAWIARDMAESGDWITPRLYGKPWFEKPPLYYWGAAICFKLFGVSEAAARLPSAMSALLATLTMAWLAWRIYGAETARWLLLLLPTTVGMIGFSHAAATDMPFSATLTIAMVCAAVIMRLLPERSSQDGAQRAAPLQDEPDVVRRRWIAPILFGFFLGLAVLAKGPAAIILCGGAVFFWALFTKRWRDALCLLHPAAIAAFCATALPWYILVARRNSDFFRIFIIEHNLKRYVTPEFQHIQPFWFYVPILLLAVVPWIALFLPTASRMQKENLTTSPKLLFLTSATFTVLFFSASQSKLPGYVLPAVPAIMLLFADACTYVNGAPPRLRLWTGILFGLTMLATLYGVARVGAWNFSKLERSADVFYTAADHVPGLIFLLGGVLALTFGATRRIVPAFIVGIITITAGLEAFPYSHIVRLDDLSAKRFLLIKGVGGGEYPADQVASYQLKRSFQYTLSFYLHRELPQWHAGDRQFKWVFTDFKNVADAKRAGLKCNVPGLIVIWTPVVVCENPNSTARTPSSGQPQ
jgi:4-amino-4-deoxy-L-arabinose transferase-like glycosyltransferase